MPHLSWEGTPQDHRPASPRAIRRALAIVVVGGLLTTGCSGDDEPAAEGATEVHDDAQSGAPTAPPGSPGSEAPAASEPAGATSRGSERSTGVLDAATAAPATMPGAAAAARCGPGVEPSGPVELTVWHALAGDAEKYFIGDVVPRFEADHPHITVSPVKGDVNYPSGITDFAAMDPKPDVLNGANLTVRAQADSGQFIPIEECGRDGVPPQFADLLPAIDLTYRVDDVLWAAPYNTSTPLLMYDGNVWRQAGLDPDDPPATLDELLDTARALHESGVVSRGLVLYNKSALWLITETAAKEGRLLIEPNNGHGTVQVEPLSIITDEVVALIDEVRTMKQDDQISWTKENFNNEDLIELVTPLTGSGMTMHTSAALGDIFRFIEAGQLTDLDVRVAPMPGPGPGAIPGGAAWWLTDGDDPDRVAAAWQFIDWMTQPEQIAELAAYTGYIPTTPTAAALPITIESWEEHPQLQIAYEQVAVTPGTPAAVGVQVGPLVEFFMTLEIALAQMIDVGDDSRATLTSAVERMQHILDVYGDR